nr:hypothetical protein [Tanacetum cinerariifolium]
MALTMTTHNVGRRTTTTRGGRTGRQTGRGGGRTSEKGGRGNGVNGGVDEVPDFATVIAHQNDNAVNDNIHEDDRNANVGNGRNGCSYMEFVACNPKEFDGKGGVIAYTPWVEKMEAIQDISGCGVNQKVKYAGGLLTNKALTWWNTQKLEAEFWCHSMVGDGHVVYIDRFYELARLVHHLVMLETKRIERYIYGIALQIRRMVAANEPPTIQHAILKAKVLTNEAIRNGSLKKSGEKRGDGGESSKEGNVKCDKKLGWEKCLLQSPTLLGESTRVRHPNVQTAISTITPRRLVLRAQTKTA